MPNPVFHCADSVGLDVHEEGRTRRSRVGSVPAPLTRLDQHASRNTSRAREDVSASARNPNGNHWMRTRRRSRRDPSLHRCHNIGGLDPTGIDAQRACSVGVSRSFRRHRPDRWKLGDKWSTNSWSRSITAQAATAHSPDRALGPIVLPPERGQGHSSPAPCN